MRVWRWVLGVVLLGATLAGLSALPREASAQSTLGCSYGFRDVANNRDIYLCTEDDTDGLRIVRLFGNEADSLVLFSDSRNVTVLYLVFMEQDSLWLEGGRFVYTIDATSGPQVCDNGVCVVGANAVLTGGSLLDIRTTDGGRFVLRAAGSGIGVRGDDATVNVNSTTINARAFGIRLSGGGAQVVVLDNVIIDSGLTGVLLLSHGSVTVSDSTITSARGDGIRIEGAGENTLTLENVTITVSTVERDGVHLANGGTVDATNVTIIVQEGDGIELVGPGSITFSGSITVLDSSGSNTGLRIVDESRLSDANSIVIAAGSTIVAQYGAIIDGAGTIVNNGTVTAEGTEGLYIRNSGGALSSITNNGTVIAQIYAIDFVGPGSVVNNGHLQGRTGILTFSSVTSDAATVILRPGSTILATQHGLLVLAITDVTIESGATVTSDEYGLSAEYASVTLNVEARAVLSGEVAGIFNRQDADDDILENNISLNDFIIVGGATVDNTTVLGVVPGTGAQVLGGVYLGYGDDLILIGLGAVVDGLIDGGTGGEVDGDTLFFGTADQVYCTSDPFDPQARAAEINALDGTNGSTSIAGQSYTFQNFEEVRANFSFTTCEGRIADGRVNLFDLAAPVVSHCTTDGGLGILEVGAGGQGTLSLGLSRERLDAALAEAARTGAHQLVAQDEHGTRVYALSDGVTIQVHSPEVNDPGKDYIYQHNINTCRPQ